MIGSGATAVSLVPALAEKAERVTMLQRSPSYLFPVPGVDPLARALRRFLPPKAAYAVMRWKDILGGSVSFWVCRHYPEVAKRVIRKAAERSLPADFDFDTHLGPSYNPWEQRPCALRDGDLYEAISEGRAEIVTDRIETFTESGLRLESGAELEADVIVTATGFNLQFLGGIEVVVERRGGRHRKVLTYKGMMIERGPQPRLHRRLHQRLLDAEGRTHLRVRLPAPQPHGRRTGSPRRARWSTTPRSAPSRSSTSAPATSSARSTGFPKQGSREPWRLRQNYFLDARMIRRGPIEDGALRFSSAAPAGSEPAEALAG